jgi:hypothetical protein
MNNAMELDMNMNEIVRGFASHGHNVSNIATRIVNGSWDETYVITADGADYFIHVGSDDYELEVRAADDLASTVIFTIPLKG